MADSNIEWTDKVWNPVTGCTQISAGCKNCYAKRMANRLKGRYGYLALTPFVVTPHPKRLKEPLKWKKPKRVFVCSMGDFFHEDVTRTFIAKVFDVAFKAYVNKGHTFLFLTKRPERMKDELFLWGHFRGYDTTMIDGFHFGVSVENQETADERIPLLLQTPAAQHFVSYEPAIGPVDFSAYIGKAFDGGGTNEEYTYNLGIDQIIMGGETGPGARPMHPDWARSVRDQCAETSVPFFFKSHGEWLTKKRSCPTDECYPRFKKVHCWNPDVIPTYPFYRDWAYRVGKKHTGHRIGGKEYRELI